MSITFKPLPQHMRASAVSLLKHLADPSPHKGVHRGTSRIIKAMEDRDWVRVLDQDMDGDALIQFIGLTDAGREALNVMENQPSL